MSLRLLLADDHELLREGLRRTLDACGFTIVAEADDGRQAVDLALAHRPDIALLDIGMPELDGIEATRRILHARPNARIALLTAHDDLGMRDAARQAGAAAYVVKTASSQEISDVVRALARGETGIGLEGGAPSAGRRDPRSIDHRFRSDESRREPRLTKRETEVLQMFANGRSTIEVARGLEISQKTVKYHLTSIYQKLDVRDRTEAVLQAVRMGIISLERRSRPRI
jgi:DNA-binding NarL/FixJ family response regulator